MASRRMNRLSPFAAFVLWAGCGLWTTPAPAQTLALGEPGDERPIEVLADNGIEWQRDAKRFIARENASAKRGDTTVYADTLIAFYREKAAEKAKPASGEEPTGKTEIWRLEAQGHVRIVSPTETVTGDTAVYDVDNAVLVIKAAAGPKLTTPDTTVTARDSLEYWETKRQAVARGNAVAVRDGRTLKGDVLVAYFADKGRTRGKAKAGKAGVRSDKIEIVDAFGHVEIVTPSEKATGDKGRYNLATGIATLIDSVTLTRDQDVMNGAYAVVDTNREVSTLYAKRPGSEGKAAPVRGRFIPKNSQPPRPAPASAQPEAPAP